MNAGNLIRTKRIELGLSQAALGKLAGCSQVAIKKIESGETVKSKYLPKIAEVLKIPLAMLDPSLSQSGHGNVNHQQRVNLSGSNPLLQKLPEDHLIGRLDLPVYAIVQGGHGALVLSSEPFTSIARPQILLGLKGAYGVLVFGNSMAREFNEGDIAYIDPNRHPRKGDPCLFQAHREDGTVEATLRYLARSPDASDTLWYVEQTNPLKRYTLKKAEWQICHVSTGKQWSR